MKLPRPAAALTPKQQPRTARCGGAPELAELLRGERSNAKSVMREPTTGTKKAKGVTSRSDCVNHSSRERRNLMDSRRAHRALSKVGQTTRCGPLAKRTREIDGVLRNSMNRRMNKPTHCDAWAYLSIPRLRFGLTTSRWSIPPGSSRTPCAACRPWPASS